MTLEQLRDLSLVFLLCQAFLVILGGGIALFYTVRGMAILDREMRIRLPIARKKVEQTASATEALGVMVTEPIIAASSRLAQTQRVFESLLSPLKHRQRG